MKVLVTGGTGFIGSHTCVELLNAGYDVVIADNLYNSKALVVDRIEKITGVRPEFFETDILDFEGLEKVFQAHEYDAIIHVDPESGGAYVAFPWDLRAEFGKGRLKVHAAFDGIPYDGSIVNMGVKNEDGSVCYVIGVLKAIRNRLGKGDGDSVHVVITAAGGEKP